MTKKLQIVRVDNDLVQKANLQIGNNIIGRGAATGCNDGEVLKHAVTINLSPNDEMTITPVAPCYMKPAGCTRWQSLKLGSSVAIKPGDACSLLPDRCWFKIISIPETMETDQTLKRKADTDLNNEEDNKKTCLSSSMEAIASPSETLNDILSDKQTPIECQYSFINGKGEHSEATKPVLQEIYSASSPEGDSIPAKCSKTSSDSQDVIESSAAHEGDRKRKAKNINLTHKAATNDEPEKKIKWDCGAHFSDQVKTTSMQEVDHGSPVAMSQDPANVSDPDVSEVPKREKCVYGTQCYRKNPNHKNNYSHPGDADYNQNDDQNDDREECPYGVKCYRKNPQHKAEFKHTIVSRRRKATPVHSTTDDTASETDASSVEESVDESEYEPSVYTESSNWDSASEWEDGTTG